MDESTNSSGLVDNDVIEIIPMEEYDSHKAKLRASLSWILEKSYREQLPSEFRDPFYETADGSLHVKPRLVNMMVTSELYCQACSNMFGDSSSHWQGHWSIIQVLSRKGIYVAEPDETEVTETILMKNAPFQINAHLALIDALMVAYVREVVTIERTVQAVRRFANFNASSDLPSDAENALVFWLNKVCSTVQLQLDREQKEQVLQGETNQKVRIVSRTGPRESTTVPLIDDLLQDIGDGCSLAILVSFYCPASLKRPDICLKTNVGIADSLYNLRLVKMFCEDNVPGRVFHLTYEDFLYTHNNLQQNLYVLLAEFFYWFEIQKLECVQDVTKEDLVNRPATAKKLSSSSMPQVPPVSNVTKQSFHKSVYDDSGSQSPQTHASVPPRQPLLRKRQQQGQTSDSDATLPGPKSEERRGPLRDKDMIHESVLAWQERNESQQVSTGQSQGSNLLANVSIDLDLMESFTDENLGSIDFDLSDSTPPPTLDSDRSTENRQVSSNLCDPNHPDYMEVQSVKSGATTTRTVTHSDHDRLLKEFSDNIQSGGSRENLEPLQPARLKPRKEKSNNHTKDEERGELTKATSPQRSKRSRVFESTASSGISEDSSGSVPEVVTPLPEDQLSENETLTPQNPPGSQPDSVPKPRYAVFTVNTEEPQDIVPHKKQSHVLRSSDSDSVKLSYTISNQVYTPETARHAGIPVVGESGEPVMRTWGSREGSVASSRSSGDFSDHESHKIHRDHKIPESSRSKDHVTLKQSESLQNKSNKHVSGKFILEKPAVKIQDKKETESTKKILTTNFAEIKRLKTGIGNVDNSGFAFMQHGQEPNDNQDKKFSLKDNFQKSKSEKKTTFSTLPNQTTWQQTTNQVSGQNDNSDTAENRDPMQPVLSELTQIRLKLEEKRKMIERKKYRMEVQQQNQRQKLGKSAFMHVVSKTPQDGVQNGDTVISAGSSSTSGAHVFRPSSLNDPQPSTSSHGRNSRPFSREGIQQTIENVKKKWFKETDEDEGEMRMSEPEEVENAQVSRAAPPSAQKSQTDKVPQASCVKKCVAAETKIGVEAKRESPARQEVDYDGYNVQLDRMGKELSDLQGQIMRMSLEQEHINGIKNVTPTKGQQTPDKHAVKEVHSTPKVGQMKHGRNVSSPLNTPERAALDSMRGVPVTGVAVVPTPERVALAGGEPHHQQPQKLPHGQHSHHPPVMEPPSHGTPVITSQNMYSVTPGMVPYSGYPPGQSPYPQPQFPPHVYQQQSPPYPHPIHPPHMSPMSQYGMPPMSIPYTLGGTPPQYHPYSPVAATHTVHSHHQAAPPPPFSVAPSHHTGAQVFHPNQSPYNIPSSFESHSTVRDPPLSKVMTSVHNVPYESSNVSVSQHSKKPHSEHERNVNDMSHSRQQTTQQPAGTKEDANQNGFFVSFGDSSPRRQKPKLSVKQNPSNIVDDHGSPVPSHTTSQDPPLDMPQQQLSSHGQEASAKEEADTSGLTADHQGDRNVSGVGFVIGQDDLSQELQEDEMQKKKDKLIQMQLKRREEQEKKRQYKEIEMARKMERDRLKQEETERRKVEERSRREQIFRQYQEKKHQEETDHAPPVRRRAKSREKARPKSMFVKTNGGSGSEEGLHSHSSQEDLSSQAFTISPGHSGPLGAGSRKAPPTFAPRDGKMRKAVSCNTLSSSSNGDGKLTFRRPPSPDLGRLRGRGRGSNESSETGSNTGSDYSGPKLFVKPSSKSNRHIIINAVSQCCLAGPVNADQKNKVLEELAKTDGKHFLILFRDHSCQYRGLYTYDPDSGETLKILGIGPKQLTNKMIERFYKYNSGGKCFSEVTSTKHLSVSIDAVVIQNALWKTGKAPKKC